MSAAAIIVWDPVRLPTDYVVMAGRRTPGTCEIVGASARRKLDVQDGYAFSGGAIVYTGDALAKFSIRIKLYSTVDWFSWWAFRPIIDKRPKFTFDPDRPMTIVKEAIDIWHPFLEPLGIHAVVVEEEMQPVLNDETGEWVIEIKLIQWRKQKIAFAKPVAAKESPAVPDEAERQILTRGETIVDLKNQLAGATPP